MTEGSQQDEDNGSDNDMFIPMADTTNHMQDLEEESGFHYNNVDNTADPGYHTTYTKCQRVEIFLLKLCTEMEAPLYAFEEIMKWARDKLWMGMENQRPEEVEVSLPGVHGEDTIKVTRFDFTTQLRSLLDDPVLNRDENLVINTEDRFQKYISPDGRLSECLSGSWYNHAWDEMVNDGICDFMIPTPLSSTQTRPRFQYLESLVFSLCRCCWVFSRKSYMR